MMSRFTKPLLWLHIVGFTWVLQPARAQTGSAARTSTTSGWAMYTGDHQISPNWAVHLEAGAFWHGVLGVRELQYLRPGIRRELPHNMAVLVTYSRFAVEPFLSGRSSTQIEHRVAEDVEWKHSMVRASLKGPMLTHRLRLEQRMLPGTPDGNTFGESLQGRLRYRANFTAPLRWSNSGLSPAYAWVYDEVFLNIPPNSASNPLDQNLAAGGFGWRVAPHTQHELGYLHQYDPTPAGMMGTFNHVLYVRMSSSLPFTRKTHRN